MNGYDFDKTIYSKDSTTQFFLFMLTVRPYLILFLPWYLIVLLLYGLKILSKKSTKQCLFFFVPWHKNIGKLVDKFWAKNANKMFEYYAKQKKEDDVVISASLEFIIKPVADALGIKHLIATKFDIKSGKIVGENCYGEEKLKRFHEEFKGAKLDAFYSDSMSDLPMMQQAQEAFLVKRGVPQKIEV